MSNKKVARAKKEVRFVLRKGARSGGVDVDVIGHMMQKIMDENSKITAELWVEYASDEESPVHNTLTWDDSKAAHLYRLAEARNLIRAVMVERNDVPEQMFVHVDSDRGYQSVSTVVQNADMYSLALIALRSQMADTKNAVDTLVDAAKTHPQTDNERLARITMAVEALHVADSAIQSIH